MNWKSAIFCFVLLCLQVAFFFSFATFMFSQQEEMQLFIPDSDTILSLLFRPGGVSTLAGLAITQFYCVPLFAACVNALLLTGIFILCMLLFSELSQSRGFSIVLALFPLCVLIHYHLNLFYVVDGTVAVFLMLLCLYCSLKATGGGKNNFLLPVVTAVVFIACGKLVVFHVLLLLLVRLLRKQARLSVDWTYFAVGLLLFLAESLLGRSVSLAKGLEPLSYHESQLSPDSLVCYVWLRFCLLLSVLVILSRCLSLRFFRRKTGKACFWTVSAAGVIFTLFFTMPNRGQVRERMFYRLSYESRKQRWDSIVGMHYGKRIQHPVNAAFLNMALSCKGALGNRLFYFDQHGPAGLFPAYNNTYFQSVMLSDIYYNLGAYSTSESYAMEALTLTRRGGGPRVLQRLVEISIKRNDKKLALKYLSILERMPVYREWSGLKRKEAEGICQSPTVAEDKLLSRYGIRSLLVVTGGCRYQSSKIQF